MSDEAKRETRKALDRVQRRLDELEAKQPPLGPRRRPAALIVVWEKALEGAPTRIPAPPPHPEYN